ncbi:MAG: RNA polymerase sigma factor [Planctomycetota bacterium]|jgi:RNA polymerase sigma factor (sigma-70 family)
MAENEIILLRRFAGTGDAEAFSEIVRRHAGLVYGACLRVLEDNSRAADVVQETFLQLVQDAGSITGSVAGWLHRVATRKALDTVRSEGRRRRREAKYAARKLRETGNWEDLSAYVDEALEDLDEEIRDVLMRHFFEGRTTTDIAAERGVSQATVSRRIESGVGGLRMKLHNRGILVAAGALGSLLVQNAAEAAPAMVLKELGKVALVGAKAAAATSVGGTAVVSGAGAVAGVCGAGAKAAVAGGLLTGLKAKIVVTAAAAAVGVGSLATYRHVTSSPEGTRSVKRESKPVRKYEPKTPVAVWTTTTEPAQSAPVIRAPEKLPVRAGEQLPEQKVEVSQTTEPASAAPAEQAPRGYGAYYGSSRVSVSRAGSAEQETQESPQDANSSADSNSRTTPVRRVRRWSK